MRSGAFDDASAIRFIRRDYGRSPDTSAFVPPTFSPLIFGSVIADFSAPSPVRLITLTFYFCSTAKPIPALFERRDTRFCEVCHCELSAFYCRAVCCHAKEMRNTMLRAARQKHEKIARRRRLIPQERRE